MEKNALTQNEVLAITSALELHIEDLQLLLKFSSKRDKLKISENINWAKETIRIFSMQQPTEEQHIYIAVAALQSLLDMPIDNNNSKEIHETLAMRTITLSALNKLKTLINFESTQP